jgi:uncharacterized phage protein gp47/JayE
MSFRNLTETQIVSNLIDTYSSLITTPDDMNVGSSIRSIFEAFAQELARLYRNYQESTAENQKLFVYSWFKFPLLPAQPAYTQVQFSVPVAPTTDITVPAGTTVAVPGTSIQYKTPAVATWPKGQTTFNMTVVCTQAGSIGNQRANTVTQLVTPITGLNNVSVTNPKDIRTGSDLETEDQRANRFQQWINTLHAGDTRAIIYGAKTAQIFDDYGYVSEKVVKAQLVEGNGSNTLYIDNGYYDTSQQLVQQCQQVIDGYTDSNGNFIKGYKAAGVPTTVVAANIQTISINVQIAPQVGYTFDMIQQSVIDAITSLVQSLDVGQALKLSDLNVAIGNTPGVLNFRITAPTADITPANGTLLKLDVGQPYVTPM